METSCPGRPDLVSDSTPLGMYHCEYCGVMVIAGLTHPNDDDVRDQGILAYKDIPAKQGETR